MVCRAAKVMQGFPSFEADLPTDHLPRHLALGIPHQISHLMKHLKTRKLANSLPSESNRSQARQQPHPNTPWHHVILIQLVQLKVMHPVCQQLVKGNARREWNPALSSLAWASLR